ncbi:MAG TPA: alpha/beta fold hydrolase [Pseudonocardia sp.]|uniref:alpha/beta hydrolase n=1 Tax=Pseudonocardia sp. TaxID=60912 RepID=UPI002BFF7C4D|nr:alpha/beta fold hydrolase [Pseudonocardia sp.]HTF51279.1 alpha/beta fold hydrolase [Pseudonocardia sp.]
MSMSSTWRCWTRCTSTRGRLSSSCWRPVLGPLTEHHEVFAPTLAGHRGGPELPPGPAPLSVFVDHVERDLDAAGFDTVHVAGNSLGGRVAVELARRGRARSVTAFSPGCTRRPWPDGIWLLVALGLLRASLALEQLLPVKPLPAMRRWPRRLLMEHGERLGPDERKEALDDMRGRRALPRIAQAGHVEPRMSPLPGTAQSGLPGASDVGRPGSCLIHHPITDQCGGHRDNRMIAEFAISPRQMARTPRRAAPARGRSLLTSRARPSLNCFIECEPPRE